MAEKRRAPNLDGQGVPSKNDTTYLDALRRSRGTEDADHWERQARLAAIKFGVDPDLSPRDRAMAIARKFKRSGGVGGGFRSERVPGEDDE